MCLSRSLSGSVTIARGSHPCPTELLGWLIVPQLMSVPGIREVCVRRHTELAVSSLFVINSAIMFKGLMDWYLARLESGGYPGIVLLMAMESSILPLPSELVIPPAAHLAHTRGNLSMIGIITAGTFGSWLGALVRGALLGRRQSRSGRSPDERRTAPHHVVARRGFVCVGQRLLFFRPSPHEKQTRPDAEMTSPH